jgi:hypothetical protein
MSTAGRNRAAIAMAVSTIISTLAGCASADHSALSFGSLVEGRSYDRKVLIGARTEFVNVNDGEVIRFVVHETDGVDKSYTWRFEVPRETVGDLSKLAPAGILGRPLKVYVGPNPRYVS